MSATVGIWLAALGTLAMMSLLIKENFYYRFFEHLFIGMSAGHALVLGINNVKTTAVTPPIQGGKGLLIVPVLLGCALYTRYWNKAAWLSRIPIALLTGVGAGLGIKGAVQAQFLDQIKATFLPLNTVSNVLFGLGVISTIWYFFFVYKQPKAVSWLPAVGRWTMMVTFGASFGNAAMGRLSLLIGRFQFLLKDWLSLIE
ncbi:MAG: hypothetical protein ACM3WU_00285 [Bacillota bacterium]